MVEGVWNISGGKCLQEPIRLKTEKFQECVSQFLSNLYCRNQDDIQIVEVK